MRLRGARGGSTAMSCHVPINISLPWWARRNRDRGVERGTKGGGGFVPSREACWPVAPGGIPAGGRRFSAAMSLKEGQLMDIARRGVLCRASCQRQEGASVVKQPGRERPPTAAPVSGSAPKRGGVAHAPAAVPSCPDNLVAARVVVPAPCPTVTWPPTRRAPRLEMVTTVTVFFLNGRAPCLSSSRAHAVSSS